MTARPFPDAVRTAARARDLLHPEGAGRIRAFLVASQTPQGGFSDRQGRADLYYSGFALSALHALGGTAPDPARLQSFLAAAAGAPDLSFTDRASLLRCLRLMSSGSRDAEADDTGGDERIRLLPPLEAWRCRDGGYTHEEGSREEGTVYGTFLAAQAFHDAGRRWRPIRGFSYWMDCRRTPDGGYANRPGAQRGMAPVTSAAAAMRAGLGQDEAARAALPFFETLRAAGGGYRAAAGAPEPDLLSTGSVIFARSLCPGTESAEHRAADSAFVESLWSEEGGFRGAPADPVPDAEYTFYALLALGASFHAGRGGQREAGVPVERAMQAGESLAQPVQAPEPGFGMSGSRPASRILNSESSA